MEGLQADLTEAAENAQLPWLPPLHRQHVELAYLSYNPGGFYQRHLDVPASHGGWRPLGRRPADDTCALMRSERRRAVSVLVYLNTGWDASVHGGQLRIFLPCRDDRGHPSASPLPPPDGGRGWVDVSPDGGTLVLLRSDTVEHEVLPTAVSRQCVVAWFTTLRTVSEAPASR